MKFLVLFIAFIGLVTAENKLRDALLLRLNKAELELNFGANKYKSHGFDYFSEILKKYIERVHHAHNEISKLPSDVQADTVKQWVTEVMEIEKETPQMIEHPALREIYKAGALYYAVMKLSNKNKEEPTPENLRKQVADIVVQEQLMRYMISAVDVSERQKKDEKLSAMYDVLLNNIKGGGIPTETDLQKLETEAKTQIVKYHEAGQVDEAKKVEDVLAKFMSSTYYIAKYFPLDSQTRVNQFFKAAPEHYKTYQALNALILL